MFMHCQLVSWPGFIYSQPWVPLLSGQPGPAHEEQFPPTTNQSLPIPVHAPPTEFGPHPSWFRLCPSLGQWMPILVQASSLSLCGVSDLPSWSLAVTACPVAQQGPRMFLTRCYWGHPRTAPLGAPVAPAPVASLLNPSGPAVLSLTDSRKCSSSGVGFCMMKFCSIWSRASTVSL